MCGSPLRAVTHSMRTHTESWALAVIVIFFPHEKYYFLNFLLSEFDSEYIMLTGLAQKLALFIVKLAWK